MLDILENIDTTRYIRHYWNSRDEFVREKDLYKRIRAEIKTPKKCEELVINMVELSEVYKSMINPNEETYFSDLQLNQLLTNLKTVKASSFYPIILAMKNMNYEEIDIRKVASSIETLVVRNFVVAGKVANKYEILFAKIALDIYEKELVNIEDIISKIAKNTIKDDEFKVSFAMFTSKSKPVIRYLLRRINNFIDNEIFIIDDNKKIHIEHIMPEKLGAWNVSKEEYEENLWKLGNLTLLGSEYNKKNSNKLFEYKKNIYKKSSIVISKDLINYSTWNSKMVMDRQDKLAEIALKVWNIS